MPPAATSDRGPGRPASQGDILRLEAHLRKHEPAAPLGEIELDSDEYTLADSYTLADDLTFERTNPDSVWSCFAMGRENARQMRNCISAEM